MTNIRNYLDNIESDNAGTKYFYVDQINGDDSNNGSHVAPFRTLQKAIDNIPTGGVGNIHVVGDYVLTSDVDISSKIRVSLLLYGTLTTTEYSPLANYTGIYTIAVTNSSVHVYIDSSANGKIVVPPKLSTDKVAPYCHAIFTESIYSNFADIKFDLRIQKDNYNPIIVNSGFSLVSIDEWSSDKTKLNVEITGRYGGKNRNIIVDSNSTLVSFNNATGSLYYAYNGGLTNETNDPIRVSSCVDGKYKRKV